VVDVPGQRKKVAGPRDSADAIFVHLARAAKADWLVSGDRHLLDLRDTRTDVRIVGPAEFPRRLDEAEPL
jgi:predicted nucleic acid-binding protein